MAAAIRRSADLGAVNLNARWFHDCLLAALVAGSTALLSPTYAGFAQFHLSHNLGLIDALIGPDSH